MKTVTLLFSTKQQLFDYHGTLGKIAFAIDLKKMILTSTLTPTDILCAIKKYDAKVLFAKANSYATEQAYC